MQTVVQEIIIDEKFKSLLPALDSATFELLEANLLENGCRDSLVLWGDVLIDGHNRYAICMKHDLPFNTVNKDFDSREEATIWIITTQVSRRNLNATQLSRFRGLHYEAEKKVIKNKDGKNQFWKDEEVIRHNDVKPKNQTTAERISGQYNVSPSTIDRDAKIAKGLERISEISPEAERIILSEEVKIDKKVLAALLSLSEEEIEDFAMAVENGTYEKSKSEATQPDQEKHGDSSTSAYTDPAAPAYPSSSDTYGSESPASQLSDAILRFIANGVYTELREHSRNDTQVLKVSLRSCIDILEGMYSRL